MSRKKINKPESPFKVRVENDGIYISALKQDNAQLTQLNYDLMKRYKVKTSDPVTNDVIDRSWNILKQLFWPNYNALI